MCLVVSFAFSIYFVFSAAFKTYTVFITDINTNLPPVNVSDIDTASDRLLNIPLDLMTASVSDIVDAAILLNIVLSVPTVSDNDIDCDIALNEPYSLDTESDNDIDSDAVLIELYTLDTLSDNDILGSVIVSLLISLLANESVIGCDCIAVSNGGELKYAVSNKAPKS